MSSKGLVLLGVLLVAPMILSMPAAPAQDTAVPVTFNRHVLPILQEHCQGCHRPGEIAPMSLLTYAEARPWARAMKNAVLTRKMPPWFADPGYSHYANDSTLSDADIRTLAAWADGGGPEGDAKDKPAPRIFQEGWNIKPDMIIEMPLDIDLPASGTIEYKYILVKTNFPEDMWVTAAEMRPGNRQAVHHMRGIVRPAGSDYMKEATPGVAYEAGDPVMGREGEGSDLLGKYNPGLGAQDFSTFQSAKFVPRGADIVFNIHYTPTGKPDTDKSKLGLVFAKAPPESRYFLSSSLSAMNLAIPPGDPNAEVVSENTVTVDTQLVYIQPHMHVRGKDYELRVVYPSGEIKTVFKAKFDFNWQLGYDLEKPLFIPKGARLVGISHFDNSANNKFNPDPAKRVFRGEQNWDEMATCYLGFLVDPGVANPRSLFVRSGVSLLPRGESGPALSSVKWTTSN
jgi:hypothetical protein